MEQLFVPDLELQTNSWELLEREVAYSKESDKDNLVFEETLTFLE
jgi:hypothetical protein